MFPGIFLVTPTNGRRNSFYVGTPLPEGTFYIVKSFYGDGIVYFRPDGNIQSMVEVIPKGFPSSRKMEFPAWRILRNTIEEVTPSQYEEYNSAVVSFYSEYAGSLPENFLEDWKSHRS